MNRLDIFCFTSVARTNSFSITARELRISQQAVSRHIRTLEDELGFPLFLRNYQSIRLTRAGELMLRYFEERERMSEELHRKFRRESDGECLRIGWSQWLGCPDWFHRSIEAFAEKHPDIQMLVFDLSAEELRRALEDRLLDILLTTRYAGSFMPSPWQMTDVSEIPICLLGSSRVDYKWDMLEYYPHMAAFAGEGDEKGVFLRVRKDYARLDVQPRYVQAFPTMGDVCLNILLKGGVSLGIGTNTIRNNPDFVLRESGRTASVVLCRPYRTEKQSVEDFWEQLREEGRIEA